MLMECAPWILVKTVSLEVVVSFPAQCLGHPAVTTPSASFDQLLPNCFYIWSGTRYHAKFSLSTLCSKVRLCTALRILRYIVFQMWTDLWMHTVGFIFFLVWSICISEYYSRLFNQKEWAIKDVYCANRKGGYFKTALFANIDWSFSHLKSPALSNKCLLNHI